MELLLSDVVDVLS